MKHFFSEKFNNLKALLLLLVALGGRLPAAAQATSCGSIDPAGNASQMGLYAEYYAGYWYGSASTDADRSAFFTSKAPTLRRVETSLAVNFANNAAWGDFYNGGAGPAGGSAANPDYFSARYRGGITIPTAGTYTFYLTSDDASYLFVDAPATATPLSLAGATIGNGGVHSAATKTATVYLTAGLHDLQLLYGQYLGDSYLKLEYAGPAGSGVAQQAIPATAFAWPAGLRSRCRWCSRALRPRPSAR